MGKFLSKKRKYQVASLLDRFPGFCWTSLVCFAEFDRDIREARIDDMCRRDAAACGACYCGKLRSDRG